MRTPGRLLNWFFSPESDHWLSILRIGFAFQLVLYCVSLRTDWNQLLAGTDGALVSRDLTEAIVSLESPLIPRLGWFVAAGKAIGLGEPMVVNFVWYCLLVAGIFLAIGLFCRPISVAAWLLHLGAVKSGNLATYGVDNFITIGLFYLMLSPSPDRLALDFWWRHRRPQDRHLLRFFRRVLQLHLCLIYFFGGLTKALGVGWWNGTNLWRALTRPPFDIISADVLVRFKHVFPILGIAVFLLEIGYPFFIWHRHLQRPWLFAILAMHVAIGLAMGMYLFASVMIVLNLAAFGPGILWNRTQAPDDSSSFSGSMVPSPNN
jgi:hypothetical protein